MRLDKYVAGASFLPRREAARAVSSGRVAVNGKTVTDGKYQLTDTSAVTLDGKTLTYSEFLYIMLNKPSGYITATEDAKHGEAVVCDLIPDELRRRGLSPVGRLDRDTTGLLILTDDGISAHRALSPKHHVAKTYRFTSTPELTEEMKQKLVSGVDIGERDGKGRTVLTAPAELNGETIRITEGKFHQIKRMFSAVGSEITSLERIDFSGIVLDPSLPRGQWRYLTDEEIKLFTGKE